MGDFKNDPRFCEIRPFAQMLWLSSPTMHGGEMRYMKEAYETNWMSTVGANILAVEKNLAAYAGVRHAVALSSGTAALHMAIRLAGERIYGTPEAGVGTLAGRRVFCSDLTFAATVNPVAYEGGEAVFIDAEYNTWNMDPAALERAFTYYPDVRLVIVAHLYGMPARIDEIKRICEKNDALLVEDAAESLGAVYKGRRAGSAGDYAIVSFNGNKIITGSCGGAFLTDSDADALKVRKWSTQSREDAPWYEHGQLGYNYRMSNVTAGAVRGQMDYLDAHIASKRKIYMRYKREFADLPAQMNPAEPEYGSSNFWLSCLLVDKDAMCDARRSGREYSYTSAKGKTCPDEILDVLRYFHAEGRPVWKPMHLQPLYAKHGFVTKDKDGKAAGTDIFNRGLCLPSDIKMTEEQQNQVIRIVRGCFGADGKLLKPEKVTENEREDLLAE